MKEKEIMDIEEAMYKRRTIRRYKQDPIDLNILKKLIDLARVAPMGKNIQALEFIIVQKRENLDALFSMIKFASSLPENERTPEPGREPIAYIIVLLNTKIKATYVDFDVGAAVENILLGAVKYGLGTCWMGNINALKIRDFFGIDEKYEIKHVICLGYPDEKSSMEPFEGSFTYWKDVEGMHVPKRSLDDVILKIE
jgi:nitroreductase